MSPLPSALKFPYEEPRWATGFAHLARGVAGVGALEFVYRAEEHVIQTEPYYRRRDLMLGVSASNCITEVFLGAFCQVVFL